MTKKAVIDIGSLKTKLAVFDAQSKALLQSDSHLTLLGKGIDEHHRITTESLGRLDDSLAKIERDLRGVADDVTLIGTEALRYAQNSSAVHVLVQKHFPKHTLEIVDQDKEAELFFLAVSREFPDEGITAIDIGGGSVQLIRGHYDSKTGKVTLEKRYHFKTGTYRLQQEYSPDNSVVSKRLNEARQHITRAYSTVDTKAPILVFGSTCMLDFIRSSGIPVRRGETQLHPIYVEPASLELLLKDVQKLAPEKREHYYPDGGYFMYGADYLLMNLLAAADRTQPAKIYPTNLNSSYAFI